MNPKRILILGAGAAGSIVANKIARELRRDIAEGKLEVTVLDKDDLNTNQGGFTFVPFGLYAPEDITRPRSRLISPRVKTAFGADGEISRVDLGNREVTTKGGKNYSYDYLLISTGCRLEPEAVPGLSGDLNTFYTLEGAMKLRAALKTFNEGRIVILTPEMPIACPGAPSKFTTLLDDYLRHVRGDDVRKDVEISFLWPIGNIGPAVYDERVVEVFAEREIEYRKEFKVQEVGSNEKEVVSADGDRVGYDLLISIPPHRGIEALQESGVTDENGWVPTDMHTLQYFKSPSERYDEVYAVGDAGSAKINKMGITAHFQALTTGQNLINDYLGNGVRVMYNGEQGCPIVESSYTPATDGRAYMVTWTYGNPPAPFNSTKLGWLIYRMYYYIYWDTTMKAIM